jgi:hypothetical protein
MSRDSFKIKPVTDKPKETGWYYVSTPDKMEGGLLPTMLYYNHKQDEWHNFANVQFSHYCDVDVSADAILANIEIDWPKKLSKMMLNSQNAMFERKPTWGSSDAIRAQIAVMDAFIELIVPEIGSLEDLHNFIKTYQERKPSV